MMAGIAEENSEMIPLWREEEGGAKAATLVARKAATVTVTILIVAFYLTIMQLGNKGRNNDTICEKCQVHIFDDDDVVLVRNLEWCEEGREIFHSYDKSLRTSESFLQSCMYRNFVTNEEDKVFSHKRKIGISI